VIRGDLAVSHLRDVGEGQINAGAGGLDIVVARAIVAWCRDRRLLCLLKDGPDRSGSRETRGTPTHLMKEEAMGIDREQAEAFVEAYGRTWESWDLDGFVGLFSDDVVYVEHPVDETVVGREEMERYIRKEQGEQGSARVRMGTPIVEGNQVVGEFWAAMSNRAEAEGTLAGCFIARIDADTGLCIRFRQYWFEFEGHSAPFPGWGE
jgi:hypothetical protein